MPPRRTRSAVKSTEKEKPGANTSVTVEIDDDQGAGDGDTSKIPDENISSGEISVDLEDITEVSLGEPEPSNEDTANIFDKLAEAGHVGKDTEDSVIGQGNEATSDDQDDGKKDDIIEDELSFVVKDNADLEPEVTEESLSLTKDETEKATTSIKVVKQEVKTPSKAVKTSAEVEKPPAKEVKTSAPVKEVKQDAVKEEKKTPVKGESEKEATVEDREKIIEELREKLPLPESFVKLRQLTVNIGPIKVDDLKSVDLHSILRLTTEFEIKFEKQEVDGGDKAVPARKESLGYVRIPFEIRSPQFFILIHDKLATLKIDGRDMSVKFPEQFNIALNDAKKYTENTKQRFEKLQALLADEKKRSLLVKNLPSNVEVDTLKSLFPEAVNVKLNKTEKGATGGYMVFRNREQAKKCLRTNKDVNIEDKKVLLALQVDDFKLMKIEKRAAILAKKAKDADKGGPVSNGAKSGSGRGASARGRGGTRRGASILGRGGQFGKIGSNPIKERVARLRSRQQEQVRVRQRQALMAKREAMGGGDMMDMDGTGSQGFGGRLGVRSMMADLLKMQAQALARSAMVSQSSGQGMRSMNVGQGMQSMSAHQGFMDTSPSRGSQSQFSPGNQGRQSYMDRPSPGGSGASQFDRFDRDTGRDTIDRPKRGGGGAQGGKLGRQDFRSRARLDAGGGRGGKARNNSRGNTASDFASKRSPPASRPQPTRRSAPASAPAQARASLTDRAPNEDDPAAMMAYLKSTLAKMEQKISQKSQSSGYADEGYRDTGRGDKRKMDYDDYGQESTKRVASYGQLDYDRQGNYGNQLYGHESGYGSAGISGGYGSASDSSYRTSGGYGLSSVGSYGTSGSMGGYGTSVGFGSPTGYGQTDSYARSEFDNRTRQVESRRYSSGGQGGGNYGNQGYSGQWGGRY